MQPFLDEDADLVAVTDLPGGRLELTFQGAQASRPAEEIDVDGFVGVKSHRAKGKRLTTYDVATLRFRGARSDPSGRSCPGRMLRMIRQGDFDLPEDDDRRGYGRRSSKSNVRKATRRR